MIVYILDTSKLQSLYLILFFYNFWDLMGMINDSNMEVKKNSNSKPKFCPKCGANIEPNYKFCRKCGHQLIFFKEVKSETGEENKNIYIDNESKNEDLPKTFKIPSSSGKKNLSKPVRNIGFKKLKITDLNRVEKENEDNTSLNIAEGIEKENEEKVNSYSVADEILKFHKLREKGIITPEEFEKKKNELLNL